MQVNVGIVGDAVRQQYEDLSLVTGLATARAQAALRAEHPQPFRCVQHHVCTLPQAAAGQLVRLHMHVKHAT